MVAGFEGEVGVQYESGDACPSLFVLWRDNDGDAPLLLRRSK